MRTSWRTWSHLVLGLMLVGLLAVGLIGRAQAADFRSGDHVVISADEVIDDDLLVSGDRVEVNGTVKGDLFAAGSEVIVNGNVEGSLFIGGQTLEANGQVEGSLYAGGYALTVGPEANVGRNVYFGGFSLTTERGSTIGRGLYAGDYQTILNGEVANDVNVGGVALEVNGIVGGDVKGEVGSPEDTAPTYMPTFPGSVPMIPPGLRVSDDAEIGGVTDVKVSELEPGVEPSAGARVVSGLGRAIGRRVGEFIALLIVGGLLLRFWPDIVQRASAEAQERPLPSAGWGCLVTLIFPLGVFIVGVALVIASLLVGLVSGQLSGNILSLGGATLGLAVAVFSLVFSIVTKAIVAFLAGRLIVARLAPATQPGWWADVASLALGALIYEILRAIPVLGWLVAVIVILVGLGAIYVVVRERTWPSPPGAVPASEAAA